MIGMHSVSSSFLLNKFVPSSFRSMDDYTLVGIYQDANETDYRRRMALQTLTFRHIAAIRKHTKHLAGNSANEDCLLSAWEGLVKAADRFDLNNPKEVKFITYAYWYIRKGAQQWLTKKARKDKMSFVGWGSDMAETFQSEDPSLEQQELVAKVRRVIDSFPGERQVVEAFYGIKDNRMTYDQMEQTFGIPRKELKHQIFTFKKYAKEALSGC